jgi:hypothetical protein
VLNIRRRPFPSVAHMNDAMIRLWIVCVRGTRFGTWATSQ